MLDVNALSRDILNYDAIGNNHRTATPNDQCTIKWLASRLDHAGCRIEYQSFTVPLFSLDTASLVWAGNAVDLFPMWPVKTTGAQGVTGQLVAGNRAAENLPDVTLKGKIVTIAYSLNDHELKLREAIQRAAAAGAKAVLVLTESPTGEIVAINSPLSAPAWPIPVALAGSRHASLVKMAVEQCEKVRLIITGDFQPKVSTTNVIGYLDRGAKEWIVVMTPHSGWFRCAGERGPGIALLLGLAHWASRQQLKVNFVFVTASGHELGMVGENLFIQKRAPAPRRVRLWLHLGASIATRSWQRTAQKQANPVMEVITHREVMPLLSQSNATAPIFQHPVDVEAFLETLARHQHKDRVCFGPLAGYSESKNLAYVTAMQAGYRPMITLAGSHVHFHTRMDGPFTIDITLLESIGKALTEIITGIDNAAS